MPRRLLLSLSLQATEYDGRAISLWESVHLLMEDRTAVIPTLFAHGWRRDLGRLAFVPSPPSSGRASATSDTKGHLVKPGSQRVSRPERAGSAHQDQERGLEGVVRLVFIPEDF